MKLKTISLGIMTMITLLLVFAVMDIGTSTTISGIPARVIHTMFNRLGDDVYTILEIDFVVRKIGHFGFYALLSPMIAIFLFKKFSKLYLAVMLSGTLTLILAFMDEYIQHYARGRNASYFDIVIDMAGAVTGLMIFAITVLVIKKRQSLLIGTVLSNNICCVLEGIK